MRADAAVATNREAWWDDYSLRWLQSRSALRAGGARLPVTAALAVSTIIGFCLLFGMVGADFRWMAAVGHAIAIRGRIPNGIPFAAAPTAAWHNVVVLGELVTWAVDSALGDRGLVLLQVLAVGIGFIALASDALRAGARQQAVASTCLIVALGAAPSLVIARGQLFSVALFPCLLALLRSDHRSHTRRIWLAVPLIALWSNLHGGVLIGAAVTLIYLVVGRLRSRPLETIAVAAGCCLALCANPGGLLAISYYHGVLANAAAQRGEGLWAPLSLTAPADLLLIAAALAVGVRAARARLRVWEVVTVLMLAGLTIHASRSGIWLLFVLTTPAAVGARRGKPWRRRLVLLAGAAVALLAVGVLRGPAPSGVGGQTILRVVALARGGPILASDIAAEQIALAGGRVWASDPIDAFSRRVQVSYLEWMDGDRSGLAGVSGRVRVVLVSRGSPEAMLMGRVPGFHLVAARQGFELFEKNS